MTTIATDGKSIAGDGAWHACDNIVSHNARKVVRLDDGSLFGSSGDYQHRQKVIEWLNSGGKPPSVRDFAGLRLMPNGQIIYYGDGLEGLPIDAPAAVGSGDRFALGAMDAGANAKDAVRCAIKRDPFSAGEITVLHLRKGRNQ